MKICNNCGSQMPDEANACTVCGAPLVDNQVPQQQAYQQQPYQQQAYQQQPYQQQAYQQQPYQQQPYQQQAYQQQPYQQQMYVDNGANGKATASLVLGILSLILCCLPLGIIGIVMGVQARNAMPEGAPGRGKATAGLVCSIIGCAWGGIAILCYACSAVASSSYYTALASIL